MTPLFEVTRADRLFFQEYLESWLPRKLIDIHTHVWLAAHQGQRDNAERTVTWPSLVAAENSIEDLIATYDLLFPGRDTSALIFATVGQRENLDRMNAYVQTCCQRYPKFRALLFSHPSWSAESLEKKLIAGNFLGTKAYLSHAPSYIPNEEIRIFDFFPPHQLEILNRRRGIMVLHIPRSQRLRDPVNLHQILEIEQKYPDIQLVVAHVGRAYCESDVGNAFEFLRSTERIMWDFCANTNARVFRQLIEAVGPRRILFGSDLPILRMRMRRIEENGRYVNLVPPGLYGDVSGDPNMREVSAEEGKKLTFFMYEELAAFRRATDEAGLGPDDLDWIFSRNAERLFARAAGK